MYSNIGPSHYIFYASKHRNYQWLVALIEKFNALLPKTPFQQHLALKTYFPFQSLGLSKPYVLDNILDDTPVDSFLIQLDSELEKLEEIFFKHIPASHPEIKTIASALESQSVSFGRVLAQEYLISLYKQTRQTQIPSNELYNAIAQIMEGGTVFNFPLVLRSIHHKTIEYEHKSCPHRMYADKKAAVFACHMKSAFYKGFINALTNIQSFKRQNFSDYCLDKIQLT